MHRETAHTTRRSRSLIVLVLALAIVTVFGIAAQQALAFESYSHGPTTIACGTCHTVNTSTPPKNADCVTCHTGYATIASGKTCWTCHTPGQDMTPVKAAAPANCTTVCHLANGTDSTHVAHVPDRGVCTTCHPLTSTATNANGSWHHTAQAPPAPFATKVTLKVAPTSIKLKKTVKATGTATPAADLAGVKVTLKAQRKKGAKWVAAKSATATVKATGAYSWTYKPAKKGTYRMQATIKATATYKASKSVFKTFKVK